MGDDKMDFKVLICEDNQETSELIETRLVEEGFKVVCAENGKDGVEAVKNNDINLVIMDVMMPIMDGLAAAKEIRKFSNVPILFLSAKSAEIDKIRGLQAGGDDYVTKDDKESDNYITKPFSMIELVERVKTHRRRYIREYDPAKVIEKDIYRTGDLVLNDDMKQITVAGNEIALTHTEYKILRLLMINMNKPFRAEQIYETVWPQEEHGGVNSLPIGTHISNIRKKIEPDPNDPYYLCTSYGMGYKVVKR